MSTRRTTYRDATPPDGDGGRLERRADDAAITIAIALFWAASVARVIFAVTREGAFGAVSTLALLVMIAVPFGWVRRVWMGRARSPRPEGRGSA